MRGAVELCLCGGHVLLKAPLERGLQVAMLGPAAACNHGTQAAARCLTGAGAVPSGCML